MGQAEYVNVATVALKNLSTQVFIVSRPELLFKSVQNSKGNFFVIYCPASRDSILS